MRMVFELPAGCLTLIGVGVLGVLVVWLVWTAGWPPAFGQRPALPYFGVLGGEHFGSVGGLAAGGVAELAGASGGGLTDRG